MFLKTPQACRAVAPGFTPAKKWDVSNRKPIIDRMPLAQGFDYYFGPLGANDGGIAPCWTGTDLR